MTDSRPEGSDGWRLLALATALVAVAALTALFVTRDDSPPIGEAVPVTLEELETAIGDAADALMGEAAFEATQMSHVGEYLGVAGWTYVLPDGDFLYYQRRDVDVVESGFWMLPDGEPPSVGERVETSVVVAVGGDINSGRVLDGEEPGPWVTRDRGDAPPGTIVLAQALLNPDVLPIEDLEDPEVTRETTPDGGEVWTLTYPFREGSAVLNWLISADGLLSSFQGELVDVAPHPILSAGDPSDRWEISLEPVLDPDEIPAPDTDSDFDPSPYEPPADLPLG